MKLFFIALAFITLSSFTNSDLLKPHTEAITVSEVTFASFTLINDTKEKVSIHTGSGFVSLNKGSKTSITCKVGKEVRWAESGKKKDLIFKITNEMCGKTIKLSKQL